MSGENGGNGYSKKILTDLDLNHFLNLAKGDKSNPSDVDEHAAQLNYWRYLESEANGDPNLLEQYNQQFENELFPSSN